MRPMEDSPQTASRRLREQRVVSQMIALYCAGNHAPETRTERASCGQPLCPECASLEAYAILRTRRCRRMDAKTSCERCGNHCYGTEQRARIRAIMRYAGPRMLLHHPISAIRHLIGR